MSRTHQYLLLLLIGVVASVVTAKMEWFGGLWLAGFVMGGSLVAADREAKRIAATRKEEGNG